MPDSSVLFVLFHQYPRILEIDIPEYYSSTIAPALHTDDMEDELAVEQEEGYSISMDQNLMTEHFSGRLLPEDSDSVSDSNVELCANFFLQTLIEGLCPLSYGLKENISAVTMYGTVGDIRSSTYRCLLAFSPLKILIENMFKNWQSSNEFEFNATIYVDIYLPEGQSFLITFDDNGNEIAYRNVEGLCLDSSADTLVVGGTELESGFIRYRVPFELEKYVNVADFKLFDINLLFEDLYGASSNSYFVKFWFDGYVAV